MNDSTKVTWSQVYQDFKGALSGAADALKTGSEHVYEVLVRQQVVNSITYSFTIIGMAIVAIVLVKTSFSMAKDEDGNWDWANDSPCIPIAVVGAIMTIATVFTFCFSMQAIIMGFINPEYGAIQEVREFIRRY